jgi:hypothetical protein
MSCQSLRSTLNNNARWSEKTSKWEVAKCPAWAGGSGKPSDTGLRPEALDL